jgi:hypothetical protein
MSYHLDNDLAFQRLIDEAYIGDLKLYYQSPYMRMMFSIVGMAHAVHNNNVAMEKALWEKHTEAAQAIDLKYADLQ